MNREQIIAVRFQPVAPPPQRLAYTITEVPAVEKSTSVLGSGIDGRGDIVGTYYAISDPSWLLTTSIAINDRGQIAATATHNGGSFQAVLLTPR